MTIRLTTVNPQKLKNVVRFDFNEKVFTPPKTKVYDLRYKVTNKLIGLTSSFLEKK